MNVNERYKKRYGIHIVGSKEVFVVSLDPLTGFREVEANAVCNFLSRNLDKLAVKVDLNSRIVIPVNLTNTVKQTIDPASDEFFVERGKIE